MRKYATGQSRADEAFPAPVFVGEPTLWHLAEVTAWLQRNTNLLPPGRLLEVSQAAAQLNFALGQARLARIRELA